MGLRCGNTLSDSSNLCSWGGLEEHPVTMGSDRFLLGPQNALILPHFLLERHYYRLLLRGRERGKEGFLRRLYHISNCNLTSPPPPLSYTLLQLPPTISYTPGLPILSADWVLLSVPVLHQTCRGPIQ